MGIECPNQINHCSRCMYVIVMACRMIKRPAIESQVNFNSSSGPRGAFEAKTPCEREARVATPSSLSFWLSCKRDDAPSPT